MSTIKINSKIENEKNMIKKMIQIYCKGNHDSKDRLCEDCNELLNYAIKRLDGCPFKENKKSCKNCRIHCYEASMRENIKKVMKYSGMRMLFVNPKVVIEHLFENLRK